MSSVLRWIRKPLPFRYFYATLGILAVNLLVFLLTESNLINIDEWAMNPVVCWKMGHWWTLLTYMYIHVDFNHIFFNMLGLVFVGLAVEERMGSWEFLLFYHLTGFLAGAFSLVFFLLTSQYLTFLMGASGAVFAVMMGFAGFFPYRRILIFFVVPVRAIYLVIVYAAVEVFSQILSPYSGVAHLTHLAGFAFAYLYLVVRFGLNPWKAFWARDGYY